MNHVMQEAPRVFVDCPFCDMDYVRREVNFVNYVWDRKNAQVHILVTTQSTGGGGTEFTLYFIGQERFGGMNDTLKYASKESDTMYEVREALVRVFKQGLIQYASRTPVSDYLSINFDREVEPQEIENQWNNWVFRIRMSTFQRGEEATRRGNFSSSLSAERVTHDWKINLRTYGNYEEDRFSFEDDTTISITRSYGGYGLLVRSISDHFSIGISGRMRSSTYSNIDLSMNLYPGVEYNIFPYSESATRELRINYSIGPRYNEYIERTIFGKTSELLWRHNLELALDQTQPWGSMRLSLDYSSFLHDFSKNRFSISGDASIRIFKGFSLNMFGMYSFIHDQVNLPKGEATQEDILLRRRELATGFEYFGRISLEYAFGAISNNIVNPRFGGSGGGFF
ncbi:MAG TPA: DUF481 domain-containing protein [bacterium]|nr:DUF481 domain-containing protein [bacterium]